VKHRAREIIGRLLAEIGVSVEPRQVEACAALAEWLAPAAAKLGLTQFDTAEALAENLIGPGLYLLPHIGEASCWLGEVGAGSGALGLSIALLRPDVRVDVLDRRQRAWRFIGLTNKRFRIGNCRSMCVDMREVPEGEPKYDLIVARAVAPEEELFQYLPEWIVAEGRIALLQTARRAAGNRQFCRLVHQMTNLAGLWLDIYGKSNGDGIASPEYS